MTTPDDVLVFWFGSTDIRGNSIAAKKQSLWFAATPEVDADIKTRFGTITESAQRGELDRWRQTLEGELALLLVCDQLSRNIYRGTRQAFAADSQALAITMSLIQRGEAPNLGLYQQIFLGMPLEHSEDLVTQQRSVDYFRQLQQSFAEDKIASPYLDTHYRYALAHQEVIERFGRFPHRNAALGRTSTQAEKEWLAQGGGFK